MSMRLSIESTDKITSMDGVPVRLWMGTTDDGQQCLVFVHRVAVPEDGDRRRFEQELNAEEPPKPVGLSEIYAILDTRLLN
jgi:hypothetical protein